jgi:hypothetical protein
MVREENSMSPTPGTPDKDHAEHRSVTLADLVALVAGIAVVMVLPARQSYWPYPTDFLGPWPRWLPWFFCLRQALGAACMALVPVILRRRACYGGSARPAEFLVLCTAMPFLIDSIETALIRLNYRLWIGDSLPGFGLVGMPTAFVDEWRKSSHWYWEYTLLLSGAVGLAGFLLGRRKLPEWLLTAFLIIAWVGAYEAGPELTRWVFRLHARVSGQPIGETAGVLIWAVGDLFPRFVLYSVPAMVAVRDVRHTGRSRPSWLEWTGLGLVAALFAIAEPTELVRYYSVTRGAGSWALETLVRAVTMLAALVIGLLLCRFGKEPDSRIESNSGPT